MPDDKFPFDAEQREIFDALKRAKFPLEPLTMRHEDIRAGSPKRSEAENDNPNVTDFPKQPDDPGSASGTGPGEGTGGPKYEAPDTAGAGIAEDVDRASRRAAFKEAVTAGLYAAAGASVFMGAIWLLVWLAG